MNNPSKTVNLSKIAHLKGDLRDFQNAGLLRFTSVIAQCQADRSLYPNDLSGLDPLEFALAAATGIEAGVLAHDRQGRLEVTTAGRAWAARRLAPFCALITPNTAGVAA